MPDFKCLPFNLIELGELPILTLHKIQQKMEDRSGKFYPPERGMARVCNPVGGSYMTARPFRCNTIYRYCEPVHISFDGETNLKPEMSYFCFGIYVSLN